MALSDILDEAASLRQERRSMLDRARRHIARIKELETRADKLEEALHKILEETRCWGWDFNPDDLEKIVVEALGDAAPSSEEGGDEAAKSQ